ncbi:type III secretion system needle filament subunit SctF [Hafnia paralvei]|uniref:type III secretion system needle filament subunit SctF n=1 Tax=Hafnia paralvei TaxID=546367 RepID=UPI00300D3BA6
MSTINLNNITGAEPESHFLVDISEKFESHATQLYTDLQSAEADLEKSPSDPAVLAKYQAALQEYTTDRNTQASVIKKYADTVATMLQKLA